MNKATGNPYECVPPPVAEKVNEGIGLTDGIPGYTRDLRRWVIFRGDTVRITVDLGKAVPVNRVAFAFLWRPFDTLWPASKLSVSVSTDSKTFTSVGSKEYSYDFTPTEATRFPVSYSFPEVTARYICLELLNGGLCPEGYYHAGQQSRLAIDEIEFY